jgi:predicted alpha/beta-hydrolase family hydrolase
MEEVRVPVRDFSVSASVYGEGGTAVLLGHGAGGNRRTPLLVDLAEDLAGTGRRAVLYNYAYTDAGRRAPDAPAVLEATAGAVGEFARATLGAPRLVHGGKSMGGRIASQAVAKGAPADGLVFLGYPLHPPGKPDQRREAHLPSLTVPLLFVQGTRDAFARWDLLQALLARLGERAALHVVEGGDHSFVPPRSGGLTRAQAEAGLRRAVLDWLEARGL